MARPAKWEHHRYLGDKRTQVVYDLDAPDVDEEVVSEVIGAEAFLAFAPDSLAEARNRGYRLWNGHQAPTE